jgi:hypothetical protein
MHLSSHERNRLTPKPFKRRQTGTSRCGVGKFQSIRTTRHPTAQLLRGKRQFTGSGQRPNTRRESSTVETIRAPTEPCRLRLFRGDGTSRSIPHLRIARKISRQRAAPRFSGGRSGMYGSGRYDRSKSMSGRPSRPAFRKRLPSALRSTSPFVGWGVTHFLVDRILQRSLFGRLCEAHRPDDPPCRRTNPPTLSSHHKPGGRYSHRCSIMALDCP